MNRKALIAIIVVLLLVLSALMLVVLAPGVQQSQMKQQKIRAIGTNPTLDVRYQYDADLLVPGDNDPRAEYPLRLDGIDWGIYGKRIRGLGGMLETKPGPVLFDFVASQHADTYENWYLFEMSEEFYEDATIQNKLAIHCTWVFERNEDSKDWPGYFPEVVKAGNLVHMQGWTLFSNNDLFYFYTFSHLPIGEAKQAAVVDFLNSLEFGALLGSDKPTKKDIGSTSEHDQPKADDSPQADDLSEESAQEEPIQE